MGTMEDLIRKAVREEIARALGAVGAVADGAMGATGGPVDIARGVVASVMERVARDVLANVHPALEPEHTASTPPVHTITGVPERASVACTCIRHTHVMGNGDWCGLEGCFCRTPVRARAEHAGHTILGGRCLTCSEAEHASTEAPRTCSVCEHGEHDQGKCGMHVYLRGVASPCPCLASRTLGAQTVPNPCSCPGGHRKAVNGQCQMCGHKAHNPAGCTGRRSFE